MCTVSGVLGILLGEGISLGEDSIGGTGDEIGGVCPDTVVNSTRAFFCFSI